ncbi:ATP-binding protein [Maridesulfovibrio salexigens]|uniref:Putative anti-sigma regulatory factor, serine/threonine protein kinase n=1 Tax=Maridesulfovibrio salexigens (strain ATCC 14822 / DSM 2638 / NCIMB 8403 / VKM B-1763) TaxID=526222 RepID=C6C0H9_MARSD|nr:ATP-binding protein [Maridesulfovibrio salexigens]ACS79113.1 putative anti-sigma regulatory factor, serine/threonine protein kinase [Maridesulfovibrio salexigens DSM 2638]
MVLVNNPETQAEAGVTSSFSLKSDISELRVLAEKIENFGSEHGVSDKTVFELNLVLDELFTNLVSYGCQSDRHKFDIFIELKDRVLTIWIEDDGKKFNPLDAPEPDMGCKCEDRKVGGLGIHFMRKMMDSIEYEWKDGRNKLTLTKNIQ